MFFRRKPKVKKYTDFWGRRKTVVKYPGSRKKKTITQDVGLFGNKTTIERTNSRGQKEFGEIRTRWTGKKYETTRRSDGTSIRREAKASFFSRLFGTKPLIKTDESGRCFKCNGTGKLRLECRGCDGSGVFSRPAIGCKSCKGSGHVRGSICRSCTGSGDYKPAISQNCTRCQGSGNYTPICRKCGGSGKFNRTRIS